MVEAHLSRGNEPSCAEVGSTWFLFLFLFFFRKCLDKRCVTVCESVA